MSLYRCLFCGNKGDDFDDFREPTKKDIKDSAEIDEVSVEENLETMKSSDYEWLVCNDCSKERKK